MDFEEMSEGSKQGAVHGHLTLLGKYFILALNSASPAWSTPISLRHLLGNFLNELNIIYYQYVKVLHTLISLAQLYSP